MFSIKLFLKDNRGFQKYLHHSGALCVWNFMKIHFCGSLPRSVIAHWALSSRRDHPPPTWLDRGSSPPLLSSEAASGHHPLPRALPPLLSCPCSLPHDGDVAVVPGMPPWPPHGSQPHASLLLFGFSYTTDTPVREGQQNLIPSSLPWLYTWRGRGHWCCLETKVKKKEKEQEAKLFFPDGKLCCLFRSLPYQQTHIKVPLILILSQD